MFDVARLPAERIARWKQVESAFAEPYVGISTDGGVLDGLRPLRDEGFDPGPSVIAARELVGLLSSEDRRLLCYPIDANEWRQWTNAYATWVPHGLPLWETTGEARAAVQHLLQMGLGRTGFDETRACMQLNETLAELYGDHDNLGEWTYRFALFGTPSSTEPWGWQLHGHHVDISFFVVGRQVSLCPVFLGAEPNVADTGRFAGVRAFDDERAQGLAMYRSLTQSQLDDAVLCPSMRGEDLPAHLNHPTEGRLQAGAGQDNLVLAFEGLSARSMSGGQRDQLLALCDVYVRRWPAGPARAKLQEIVEHLDDTWFAFVGTGDEHRPLYYRVHSPVLLIEFDHHKGVFLDNPEPEPFHVHTIVRTPNGGDYGKDLLRLHYENEHAS